MYWSLDSWEDDEEVDKKIDTVELKRTEVEPELELNLGLEVG